MYNGIVQQNSIYIKSCATKEFSIHLSPVLAYDFLWRAKSVLVQVLAHLCTAVLVGSMRRTLCLKLFVRRA